MELKRKILVSAYACEPFKGSEQGVGWNWVLQLAKSNHVHVITRANNQEPIELGLPKHLEKNITFHYYDTHKYIKGLKKRARGLYLYYFFWQMGIIPLVKRILRDHKVDYTMHLTMGSIWMPTFLPLFNVPFIWGPIGGGDNEPFCFYRTMDIKGQLLMLCRFLLKAFSYINPQIIIPSARASVILVRTKSSAEVIPRKYRHKTRILLETAMENDVFEFKSRPTGSEINLITTGRLLPSKNIITAVRSLKYIPHERDITFTIIGSGAQERIIAKEASDHNLLERVRFVSEISRKDVMENLVNSDIYLFPSLREGGSWALMEAMAVGLPVICLNWSGSAIITDDASAIRLPVSSPGKIAEDMAGAIMRLADDKELRLKMGQAARKRIRNEFNWDAKGVFMEKLLAELDRSSERG